MLVVTDYIATDDQASPDIGIKTFDEIDASYAAITGVDRVNYQDVNGDFVVEETYQELRQSLPSESLGRQVSSTPTLLPSQAVEVGRQLESG